MSFWKNIFGKKITNDEGVVKDSQNEDSIALEMNNEPSSVVEQFQKDGQTVTENLESNVEQNEDDDSSSSN